MSFQRNAGILAAAGSAAWLVPSLASALPLTDLEGRGLDSIYGSYAPAGDCSREPRLTIGGKGFAFRSGGRTVESSRIEHAVSFMGPAYDGISSVFFPFRASDSDMGPLVMIVNDDEKPGVIRIEADLTPGQRLDPFHAAFTSASPLLRCAGTAAAAAVPAAIAAEAPAEPAVPLDWTNLARFAGHYRGAFDPIANGPIAAAIRARLGTKSEVLARNLSVAGPLRREGSIYYLSGNAPHQGGVEQAYVLIDSARREVEVGLWERGKLTVYAPQDRRLPPPADIRQMLANSPPETALAAPGTPWEVVPVGGRPPLAHVSAAASPNIESISLFCEGSRPMMAMLLNKPSPQAAVAMTWNFAGRLVSLPMSRGNREGTFWQASLAGSPLVATLMSQSGSAYLRINGRLEGEASLAGAPAALRAALRSCYGF